VALPLDDFLPAGSGFPLSLFWRGLVAACFSLSSAFLDVETLARRILTVRPIFFFFPDVRHCRVARSRQFFLRRIL